MKNLIRDEADSIPLTMTQPVVSGQLVAVGKIVGVCAVNGAVGDTVEVLREGEFVFPKATADVIVQGEALKFDPATGIVTAAGTVTAGIATRACAAGSTQAYLVLVPSAV